MKSGRKQDSKFHPRHSNQGKSGLRKRRFTPSLKDEHVRTKPPRTRAKITRIAPPHAPASYTDRDDTRLVRVNKFLSNSGFCSRRKADELIEEGRVKINGQVVTSLGVKIDPAIDQVFINEKQVVNLDRLVYVLFNKPKDCITTTSDELGRTTVLDYIHIRERIYPIGRLDRNTTGVLLLTNDGDFANKLMHPKHEVKKAYRVTLDKPLELEHAEKLRTGIRLSDGKTAPAEIVILGKGNIHTDIGVIIHEGRNRQIHRMFEALDYVVEKLDRVAYADMTVEGLKRGGWRYLTKGEVHRLQQF